MPSSGSTAFEKSRTRRDLADNHGEPPPRWKKLAAWLGGAATVASLIVGVISIVPILNRSASGLTTFEATARVVPGEYFAVPVPAMRDFPVGSADGCSQAQRDWLGEVAQPIPRALLVEVRNVAAEGPMLSVADIRAEGELAQPATATMIVDCLPWGGAGGGKPAVLDLAGGTAIFRNSVGSSAGDLPDSPVSYNLAPGETAQFWLTVYSGTDFSGDLVATVVSGRDRGSKTIPIDGIEELTVPGSGSSDSYLTIVGGQPLCARPGLRADEPVFDDACLIPGS